MKIIKIHVLFKENIPRGFKVVRPDNNLVAFHSQQIPFIYKLINYIYN